MPATSFQRLQFQGLLGSPCEAAASEGGHGYGWQHTQAHRLAWTPRVGPRDSACRLEFHLGHVACQMVSHNCVTGSQRSPPTCPLRTGAAEGGGMWLAGWEQVRGLGLLQWHWAPSGFWPPLSPAFPTPTPSPSPTSRPSSLTPLSAHRLPQLEGRDQVNHIWFPRAQQKVSQRRSSVKTC